MAGIQIIMNSSQGAWSRSSNSLNVPIVKFPSRRRVPSLLRPRLLAAFLCAFLVGGVGPAAAESDIPFLGVFTHTEADKPLADQRKQIETVLEANPLLKGVSIKFGWRLINPQKEVFEMDDLQGLIRSIDSRKKLVNFHMFPGGDHTPGWIYEAGVRRFHVKDAPVKATPEAKTNPATTPVPWDETYMRSWETCLKRVAPVINAESSLYAVGIYGHNYKGGEMHMPKGKADMEEWKNLGWSEEVVLDNWKHWIDCYAALFPRKKLILVISNLYGSATSSLTGKIADYAAAKYPDRIILQNMQLHGRYDYLKSQDSQAGAQVRYRGRIPSSWETVGSYYEQPLRQGSVEMMMFNAFKASPHFIQLWNRDSSNPEFTRRILEVYDEFKGQSPDEIKSRLVKEGKYHDRNTTEFMKDGKYL